MATVVHRRGKYQWTRKSERKANGIHLKMTASDASGDKTVELVIWREGAKSFEGHGIVSKAELETVVKEFQHALGN